MSLARLLPVALLFFSSLAFTQSQLRSSRLPGNLQPDPDFSTIDAKPSEPWRIVPNDPLKPDSKQAPFNLRGLLIAPDGEGLADNTCFAIRSYVVARDEKDSDSTHPVKSSTCQPARRYHLRAAESPSDSR